jgi:hypothetical protein
MEHALPPAEVFFRDFDNEFINRKTLDDETLTYTGNDVLVQKTWELPVIVQWPGSTIEYEFSTARGGIEFGIAFVPAVDEEDEARRREKKRKQGKRARVYPDDDDLLDVNADDDEEDDDDDDEEEEEDEEEDDDAVEVQMLQEMSRVRSDLTKQAGTVRPPSEGVLFFVFDNVYDWSGVKKLSYTVKVHQPSFTLPDAERSAAARVLLESSVEDSEVSLSRLQEAEEKLNFQVTPARPLPFVLRCALQHA